MVCAQQRDVGAVAASRGLGGWDARSAHRATARRFWRRGEVAAVPRAVESLFLCAHEAKTLRSLICMSDDLGDVVTAGLGYSTPGGPNLLNDSIILRHFRSPC